MYQLLIVQALRPDRLLAMALVFVSTVMGEEFLHEPEQELDLAAIVENEVGSCHVINSGPYDSVVLT